MQLKEYFSEPRSWALFFLIALVGTLLLAGCNRQQQSASPPAPEVATVTMQPQQLVLTTELPGRTSPHRVAEIRPQVNGIIQKRLFTEGADVKVGDVLYQIDPAPFQAALDSAKAALAKSLISAGMMLPPLGSHAQTVSRRKGKAEQETHLHVD